jgi:hypothetical protein
VSFIECCHIIQRKDFDERSLDDLEHAIDAFFRDVKIFETLGVRTNMNLPLQHSLRHYRYVIEQFGSPSGHDTSITENRHRSAVKEPWRRSNRCQALSQMLRTLLRLDKLAAMRVYLESLGLLKRQHNRPQPGFTEEDAAEEGKTDEACPADRNTLRGYGTAELAKTARK